MKRLVLLLVPFLFFLAACNKDENTKVDYDDPDSQGNLIISNYSNESVVLYRGEERIKVLSSSSEDYLVNIPNPGNAVMDLRLYKLEDVQDDIDNPASAEIFKRWNIVLAPDNEWEHRVTWVLQATDSGLADDDVYTATLTLSYVGGTDNQVSVFLNSKNGAKIASLAPGQNLKKVGLDYGNYTVLYNYWYSDPNTPDGPQDLGWLDKEYVNGSEVDIWLVLNNGRTTWHLQIPHWGKGQGVPVEEDTYYGTAKITNNTSLPVQIYADNELIENVVYQTPDSKNMSTIGAGQSLTYILQEDEYTFTAKDLQSGLEVASMTDSVKADQQVEWVIE